MWPEQTLCNIRQARLVSGTFPVPFPSTFSKHFHLHFRLPNACSIATLLIFMALLNLTWSHVIRVSDCRYGQMSQDKKEWAESPSRRGLTAIHSIVFSGLFRFRHLLSFCIMSLVPVPGHRAYCLANQCWHQWRYLSHQQLLVDLWNSFIFN